MTDLPERLLVRLAEYASCPWGTEVPFVARADRVLESWGLVEITGTRIKATAEGRRVAEARL